MSVIGFFQILKSKSKISRLRRQIDTIPSQSVVIIVVCFVVRLENETISKWFLSKMNCLNLALDVSQFTYILRQSEKKEAQLVGQSSF